MSLFFILKQQFISETMKKVLCIIDMDGFLLSNVTLVKSDKSLDLTFVV